MQWGVALGAAAKSAVDTYGKLEDMDREKEKSARADEGIKLQRESGERAERQVKMLEDRNSREARAFERDEADSAAIRGVLGGSEQPRAAIPSSSAAGTAAGATTTGSTPAAEGAVGGAGGGRSAAPAPGGPARSAIPGGAPAPSAAAPSPGASAIGAYDYDAAERRLVSLGPKGIEAAKQLRMLQASRTQNMVNERTVALKDLEIGRHRAQASLGMASAMAAHDPLGALELSAESLTQDTPGSIGRAKAVATSNGFEMQFFNEDGTIRRSMQFKSPEEVQQFLKNATGIAQNPLEFSRLSISNAIEEEKLRGLKGSNDAMDKFSGVYQGLNAALDADADADTVRKSFAEVTAAAREADIRTGRNKTMKIKDAEGNERTVEVGAFTEMVKGMIPRTSITTPDGKVQTVAASVEAAISPNTIKKALGSGQSLVQYQEGLRRAIDARFGKGAYALYAAEAAEKAFKKIGAMTLAEVDAATSSQPGFFSAPQPGEKGLIGPAASNAVGAVGRAARGAIDYLGNIPPVPPLDGSTPRGTPPR